MSQVIDAFPVGTVLSGYELQRAIGYTPNSVIYEANHTLLGTDVWVHEFIAPAHMERNKETGAWQILAGHETAASAALEQFVASLRQLRQWSHPCILPIVNALALDELGVYACVLPRLPKCTKPKDAASLCSMLEHVLSVVKYLRSQGVIPSNFLLYEGDQGAPCLDLVDFVSPVGQKPAWVLAEQAPIEYLQPGIAPVGEHSVLYSLAAAAYNILTGQYPPMADARVAKVDPYASLAARADLVKQYGENLLGTIDKALAQWPDDRWATGDAWLLALKTVANKASVTKPSIVPRFTASSPLKLTPSRSAGQASAQSAEAISQTVSKTQDAVNATSSDVVSAANIALEKGDIVTLRKLIASGLDVNTKILAKKTLLGKVISTSETSLLLKAIDVQNSEIVTLLLESGADANGFGTGTCTPLHLAVKRKMVKEARLLLSYGADENIKDAQGKTPQEVAPWGVWKNVKN